MQPQSQELDISFLVPNVFADGQIYSLPNDNSGMPATISFIQMRPPKEGKPHDDVVASVSFSSIETLKKFVADIQEKIDEHEKRER